MSIMTRQPDTPRQSLPIDARADVIDRWSLEAEWDDFDDLESLLREHPADAAFD
jgi:hypothetical protein